MQPPHPQQSQTDAQASEKLAAFIHEYLITTGCPKTAESFKEEGLSKFPNANLSFIKPPGSEGTPGFLQSWWMLFWDIYCAAPERRGETVEASQDGKMFHDFFINGGSFAPNPMMTGPGMFPGGMSMSGPDGMVPGFARFATRPPGVPPGYIFPGDPRATMAQAQRMPPNAMRMPNPPFATPGPGSNMRPGGAPQAMNYRGPFMDSPSQAFPPGAMMPNGMGSQAMSSPGMPPVDGSQFMMGAMPSSSTAMPFGMGDPSVSMGNGMPPSSMCDNGGPGNPSQQQVMMMNGEDMKQSPASTPRGVNGGTPAPGSAQSGQPSSGTPVAAPHVDEKPASNSKPEDMDEISKIKQGLMDDFQPKEESTEQAGGGGSNFY